jgi:hypothetical protein
VPRGDEGPRLPSRARRGARLASAAVALCVLPTACSGAEDASGSGGRRGSPAASGDARLLKGVCPDTVVVQTSWAPQVEHAVAYQLLGEGYQVDEGRKRVTGRLIAGGVDTGVQIQIRAGGPAIGFGQVSAQMYLDRSIMLGMLATDESVQNVVAQPTTAVMAPFDVDPLVIMWSPERHPDWNTISDIGQTDTPVLYFQGESTYMDYLTGTGILRKRQVDGSYDGTPSRFVASRGDIAMQGFATSEPWRLEHEVAPWKRPMSYQLVSDTGYPGYRNALFIRTGDKPKLAPCLRRLVPIFQQAMVDFMAKPEATTDLVLGLVRRYELSYQDSEARSAYAVQTMRDQGIVGNGPNRTLGEFDLGRVAKIIGIVNPIYASQRKPIRADLRPEHIATNEFVDPVIGLPR